MTAAPHATDPNVTPSDTLTDAASPDPRPRGNVRWLVCGLLFFATTINYMDRQIIGILKPEMQDRLGWTENDYANIIFAFQMTYAFGQLFAGRLLDLVGVRVGYAVSVAGWSLAAMAHGVARSVPGFVVARGLLGVAEGGNFPAAIKTISEWFPKQERALATGVFNAGSNVGAMITPLLVPVITVRYGWQAAFYLTGGVGVLWVVAWLLLYQRPERHKSITPEELAYISAGRTGRDLAADPARMPWTAVAFERSTVAYVLATMLTGPVWWFYLFWGADFLHKNFGLDLIHLGLPMAAIYLMADVGSVGGGWLSSWLIRRGWTVNAARKTALLAFGLMTVPVFLASTTTHLWAAVLLIGLAAAAHQGWSANLYTFVSDTTPRSGVSSVVGLGGFISGLAGMVVAKVVGLVLQRTGSYVPLFAAASVMYPVALVILQLLVPRIDMPDDRPNAAATAS